MKRVEETRTRMISTPHQVQTLAGFRMRLFLDKAFLSYFEVEAFAGAQSAVAGSGEPVM